MGEYTSIYLHKKSDHLLHYRKYPSEEAINAMSEEEVKALNKEYRDYGEKVLDSYGCQLIDLCTDESRELDFIPYTDDGEITPFTMEMLQEVLGFYDEKIEELQEEVKEDKIMILRLEERISKTNAKLYDKISDKIDNHYGHMEFCQKEIEECQYYHDQFAYAKRILNHFSNKGKFELVYVKR